MESKLLINFSCLCILIFFWLFNVLCCVYLFEHCQNLLYNVHMCCMSTSYMYFSQYYSTISFSQVENVRSSFKWPLLRFNAGHLNNYLYLRKFFCLIHTDFLILVHGNAILKWLHVSLIPSEITIQISL